MDPTTVYQYFAANGSLIYVGITNRGTRRLHEHAESKPWWPLATGCTLEHYETRAEALERERTLIERFRPPYNQQHNPERGLALETRAQKRLGTAQPLVSRIGDTARPASALIKERRTAFLALPKEQRRTAACVVCGVRPGNGRPTCGVCRQQEALDRPAGRMTAQEHRALHRDSTTTCPQCRPKT